MLKIVLAGLLLSMDVKLCLADCSKLITCMKNEGAAIVSELDGSTGFNDFTTIKQYWTAICSYKDNLINCYDATTAAECTEISNAVQYNPSKDVMRQQYDLICSNIDAISDLTLCMVNSAVLTKITDCTSLFTGSTESFCPFYNCLLGVIETECSKTASDFMKSYNNPCAGAAITHNAFLLISAIVTYLYWNSYNI